MVAVLVAAAPAAAHADGPPLSVAPATLAAALSCPQSPAGAARAPVLLIPGTDLQPQPNFDWNYEPALTRAGIPWCTVTLPRYALSDIQVAAEYVVYALRRMHAQAGRRVSIIGWSQGGMIGRWALKYWPDTRGMLEDLVGLAPSNHGTTGARTVCASSCPPAFWQQRDDAKFIAALNQGGETYAGVDYTVAYTHDDEIVQPNADARSGSSALRTGGGRISNVGLQDICPADSADHFALGSYDPVGWAIAYDAITHEGPADPARIDRGVCAQPFMPGVDPVTFAADYARFVGTVAPAQAQSEYVSAEPPLKCYVTGTCPAVAAPGTSPPVAEHRRPRCANRPRFRVRLDRRLRRARAVVAGHRVPVRRRGGRLVVLVDLHGHGHRVVALRARGRTRSGRRLTQTRRFHLCHR